MKSPISNVGIIDADGILNGSKINERKTNTIKNIGKNDTACSTKTDLLLLTVFLEVFY